MDGERMDLLWEEAKERGDGGANRALGGGGGEGGGGTLLPDIFSGFPFAYITAGGNNVMEINGE